MAGDRLTLPSNPENMLNKSTPVEKYSGAIRRGDDKLICRICGASQIPAPGGSTPRTRFWCRWCCGQINRARHIASSRDIALPAEWPLIGEIPKEVLTGFLSLCGYDALE